MKDGLQFRRAKRRFVALAQGDIHGRDFDHRKWEDAVGGSDSRYAAALGAARYARSYGHQIRLRHGAVRRVYGTCGWRSDSLVHDADLGGGWTKYHHD